MQFAQTASANAVHAVVLLAPAAHTVQALHEVALAADQLTPATQLEQFAFVVAVQAVARYLPAVQTLEAQAAHGV